jgi:hypothetical protein
MTEDQLLNLVAGDQVHEFHSEILWIHSIDYCRKWTIDYRIDKYIAHGVIVYDDVISGYTSTWFSHKDLDRIHLPEECPAPRE